MKSISILPYILFSLCVLPLSGQDHFPRCLKTLKKYLKHQPDSYREYFKYELINSFIEAKQLGLVDSCACETARKHIVATSIKAWRNGGFQRILTGPDIGDVSAPLAALNRAIRKKKYPDK